MSEEIEASAHDFEVLFNKSKKFFLDEEYTQEEFSELASLFGKSFGNIKERDGRKVE